jgi:MerR family transcriptional regulator, copper efflux regulator
LEEVKEILDLQQASGQPCSRVLELLDTHIGGIDQTIRALQELRATLVRARDAAKASGHRGDQAVVCRLIESQAPPRPAATARK